VPGSSRAVENESGLVDNGERITLFMRVIMACIRYVDISVRRTVSVGGAVIGNGRESRRTGDFDVE
jgi:hypothetical protein